MSITKSLDKIRKENVTKTFPELFSDPRGGPKGALRRSLI